MRTQPRYPSPHCRGVADHPDKDARIAALAEHFERLGLRERRASSGRIARCIRCLCGCNQTWASRRDAAAALGVSYTNLWDRMKTGREVSGGHVLEYAEETMDA